MIRLKVRGGTLRDERLCESCRHSQLMKHSDGSERIVCFSNAVEGINITKRVVDCSEYRNKSEKTKFEHEKIGWILEMKGKQILGFKQPKPEDD